MPLIETSGAGAWQTMRLSTWSISGMHDVVTVMANGTFEEKVHADEVW